MQSFDTGNFGRAFGDTDVSKGRQTRRRSLTITAAVLLIATVALPAQQPVELSPDLLKRLPPNVRQQYERSLHPEPATQDATTGQAPKPASSNANPAGPKPLSPGGDAANAASNATVAASGSSMTWTSSMGRLYL